MIILETLKEFATFEIGSVAYLYILVGVVLGFIKAAMNTLHSKEKWSESLFRNSKFFTFIGNKSYVRKNPFMATMFSMFSGGWHLLDPLYTIGLFLLGYYSGMNPDALVLFLISHYFSFNIFYHYIINKDFISAKIWFISLLSIAIIGTLGMQLVHESMRLLLGFVGWFIIVSFFLWLLTWAIILILKIKR